MSNNKHFFGNLCFFNFSIILAIVTLVFNWQIFKTFWQSNLVSGWDGASHAAIGEYYANNIFPSTWGWIPHWFAGMPFPQFYPPLFYFLIAILYKILPLSYTFILKALLTFLTLIIPGMLSWITKTYTANFWAATSSGLLAIFALSFNSKAGQFGIAIEATFGLGLFTQLLGFTCLLLWLSFFLKIEFSIKAQYFCGLFLWFALLANVHVVPVIAILFITTMVIRGGHFQKYFSTKVFLNWIKTYFLVGALPLAGAAFWYIPMLTHFDYVTTKTLPPLEVNMVIGLWISLILLTLLALIISINRKNSTIQIIAVSCLVIILLSVVNIKNIYPSLPIQPFRLSSFFYFLSTIPAGYVIGVFTNSFSNRFWKTLAFIILILPFILNIHGDKITNSKLYFYYDYENDKVEEIIEYMHLKKGTVNIEVYTPLSQPSFLVLNALLGKEKINTNYIVFRESSIASIFMTPLRNSFSKKQESWGIETFLSRDENFLSQDFNSHLDRAKYMGVKYFLVGSTEMSEAFKNNLRIDLEKDFGTWKLFRLKEPIVYAQVLPYEPAIFFGPVTFKKRSKLGYDFIHFQEELFRNNTFNTLIARPLDSFLDTSGDLDRFKIAIITEYNYKNFDKAFERLRAYSKNNSLILVSSKDPLFEKLNTLDNSHKLYVFNRLKKSIKSSQLFTNQLKSIFDLLDNIKVSSKANRQKITDIIFTNKEIKVSLAEKSKTQLPILIKSNYFPSWRRSNNEDSIYMTTTTFLLTYADNDFILKFGIDRSVILGILVSLITSLSVVIYTLYLYFRRRLKS